MGTTKKRAIIPVEQPDGSVILTQEKTKSKCGGANLETQMTANPGEIGTMLKHLLHHYGKPPVKTDEEAVTRISEYFIYCANNDTRPVWEELCMNLGVTRQTVDRWENKEDLANTNRSDIIKTARGFCSSFDAKAVTANKLNPVAYIFRSKNYYGMKDQQDFVLTPKSPLGDKPTEEQIEQIIDTELIE